MAKGTIPEKRREGFFDTVRNQSVPQVFLEAVRSRLLALVQCLVNVFEWHEGGIYQTVLIALFYLRVNLLGTQVRAASVDALSLCGP